MLQPQISLRFIGILCDSQKVVHRCEAEEKGYMTFEIIYTEKSVYVDANVLVVVVH